MQEVQKAIEFYTAIAKADMEAIYNSECLDNDTINETFEIDSYINDKELNALILEQIDGTIFRASSTARTAYEIDKKNKTINTEHGLATVDNKDNVYCQFNMYYGEQINASLIISSSNECKIFIKDKSNSVLEIHNLDKNELGFALFYDAARIKGIYSEDHLWDEDRISHEEKSHYYKLFLANNDPATVVQDFIDRSQIQTIFDSEELANLMLAGDGNEIFNRLDSKTSSVEETILQYGKVNELISDLGNYDNVNTAMGDLKVEDTYISPHKLIEFATNHDLPILKNNTDGEWLIQCDKDIFVVYENKDSSTRWMCKELDAPPENQSEFNYKGFTFIDEEKNLKIIEMTLDGIKDMETINIDEPQSKNPEAEVKKTRTVKLGR